MAVPHLFGQAHWAKACAVLALAIPACATNTQSTPTSVTGSLPAPTPIPTPAPEADLLPASASVWITTLEHTKATIASPSAWVGSLTNREWTRDSELYTTVQMAFRPPDRLRGQIAESNQYPVGLIFVTGNGRLPRVRIPQLFNLTFDLQPGDNRRNSANGYSLAEVSPGGFARLFTSEASQTVLLGTRELDGIRVDVARLSQVRLPGDTTTAEAAIAESTGLPLRGRLWVADRQTYEFDLHGLTQREVGDAELAL